MDILFLAHRVAYAPDRGDRIRSYHVLRHLQRRARVHLIAFADDRRDVRPPPAFLRELASCTIIERRKSRARALTEALLTGQPASLTAFADHMMRDAVERAMALYPIGACYAFSGQMAPYLPGGVIRVMDFVDADSAKFAAYAAADRGPRRWLLAREARLMAAYERRIVAQVDHALAVSAEEAALLPGATVLENGIDAAYFTPEESIAGRSDRNEAGGEAPLIVFTGQMDYRPNVEAVAMFARDVLPQIPCARFAIVGRAPSGTVRALASERVIVTGEVPDVRSWLSRAAVVVAPLTIARGVQNKVLEAMAMARPVVATPAAAEGIDHAGAIAIADTPATLAATINVLLNDRARAERLGAAARRQVLARYDWQQRLAPLDAMLGLAAA